MHLNLIRQSSMDAIFFIGGVSANPFGAFFVTPVGKGFALADFFIASFVRVFTAFWSYVITIYANIYGFCFLKVFKNKEWFFAEVLDLNAASVNFKLFFPCIVGKFSVSEFFNFFAKGFLTKIIKRFLSFAFIKTFELFMPFTVRFLNFWRMILCRVFTKRSRGWVIFPN